MTPSENRSERDVAGSPRKYSGAVNCCVPRMSLCMPDGSASTTPVILVEPKSMIFTVPVASIMMLSGLMSWCSISLRWKARSPLAICSTMPRTVSRLGFRIVDHPLRQRLPVDVFGRDIQEIALALQQAGFQHMRAVDPPRHPLLHHEPLQIGGIVAQIDRRNLDGDHGVGFDVDGEIDVAAAGAVQFAHDPVAIEHRARLQQRRQRQFMRLREHFAGGAVRAPRRRGRSGR
jgi:hypothetical protein